MATKTQTKQNSQRCYDESIDNKYNEKLQTMTLKGMQGLSSRKYWPENSLSPLKLTPHRRWTK